MTYSGQYIYIIAGANFCLLFLALCHHVYHIRGSSSPCSVSRRLPCTSHAHEIRLNHPVAKIQGKARMVRHVGRYANAMGSSECRGEKHTCFLPWRCGGGLGGTIRHHVGGRRAFCWCPHCHTLSPAFLDQGWLGHWICDEVWATFPLWLFFVSRIILDVLEALMWPLGK